MTTFRRRYKRRRPTVNSWRGARSEVRVFRTKPYLYAGYRESTSTPGVFLTSPISIYFQLSSLPEFSDLAVDWSEYLLDKALVRFTPLYQKGTMNGATGYVSPNYQCQDMLMVNVYQTQEFDSLVSSIDAQVVGGTTDSLYPLRNHYRSRKFSGTRGFTWSVKPRVNMSAYETSLKTAYVPRRSWVNTLDPDTIHYGVVGSCDCDVQGFTPVEQMPYWRVDTVYYVRFRKPKALMKP